MLGDGGTVGLGVGVVPGASGGGVGVGVGVGGVGAGAGVNGGGVGAGVAVSGGGVGVGAGVAPGSGRIAGNLPDGEAGGLPEGVLLRPPGSGGGDPSRGPPPALPSSPPSPPSPPDPPMTSMPPFSVNRRGAVTARPTAPRTRLVTNLPFLLTLPLSTDESSVTVVTTGGVVDEDPR